MSDLTLVVTAAKKAGSQLQLDLEQVKPYLFDILDSDGQPQVGHQKRIAQVLGISPGGSNRHRIMAVCQFIMTRPKSAV